MTWEEALAPLRGTMFRFGCLHGPSPQNSRWSCSIVRDPYMRDKNNCGLGYGPTPWEAIAAAIEDALNPKGYVPRNIPKLNLDDLELEI